MVFLDLLGTRCFREAKCPPSFTSLEVHDRRQAASLSRGDSFKPQRSCLDFYFRPNLLPLEIGTRGGIGEKTERSVKKWNKPTTSPFFRGNHSASASVEWM